MANKQQTETPKEYSKPTEAMLADLRRITETIGEGRRIFHGFHCWRNDARQWRIALKHVGKDGKRDTESGRTVIFTGRYKTYRACKTEIGSWLGISKDASGRVEDEFPSDF